MSEIKHAKAVWSFNIRGYLTHYSVKKQLQYCRVVAISVTVHADVMYSPHIVHLFSVSVRMKFKPSGLHDSVRCFTVSRLFVSTQTFTESSVFQCLI